MQVPHNERTQEISDVDGARNNAAAGVLFQIERDARAAETAQALHYIVVNQTRRLVQYSQALLVSRRPNGDLLIEAISNVAALDRNAPYIVWTTQLLKHLDKQRNLDTLGPLRQDNSRQSQLTSQWPSYWPENVLWLPFNRPGRPDLGGLILLRSAPDWTAAEKVLLDQLCDCYGHAWAALVASRTRRSLQSGRRRVVSIAAALAALISLAIPVRQSVIVPAQVAAQDPTTLAAPMTGVIAEILVNPNQAVESGDQLFRFEEAELSANLEVAERALAAAEADLQRTRQQSFSDPEARAQVPVKLAEVELRRTEAAFSRYLFEQVTVKAPSQGVVIFDSRNAWRGRPVQIGERIMLLADPENVRIAANIPVADAISVRPGTEVRLFLDVDPLNSISGYLEHTSYEAVETPQGTLAHSASARFGNDEPLPRIGLRGVAKIYGDTVPLALYLFRRPISALRQFAGI